MKHADQGSMTSEALTTLVRRSVSTRFPDVQVDRLDKVQLLEAARARGGWPAVVAIGRGLRALAGHPIIRAIIAVPRPDAIVERWIRLERFGHSRNRTVVRGCTRDGHLTTQILQHVAADGGPIVAVNDLFIWGVFIGLMEAAGVEQVEAALPTETPGAPFVLCGVTAPADAPLPSVTHTLVLRGRPPGTPQQPAPTDARPPAGAMRGRLAAWVGQDLLAGVNITDAARALGVSRRSLQRALRAEGTTFSEVVLRTRVEAARALLPDAKLKLTDIAFCVGFADQGHFTRTFRRFCDVPPSALRDILPAGGGIDPEGGGR